VNHGKIAPLGQLLAAGARRAACSGRCAGLLADGGAAGGGQRHWEIGFRVLIESDSAMKEFSVHTGQQAILSAFFFCPYFYLYFTV
jgi:hypothetical protein